MLLNKLKANRLLIIILVISAFFHLFRLEYPNAYVFDEVYHGFTAKEYLVGNKEAWEWWTVPPPGVAFEWTHPPLAKEIMTASMFITGRTDAWDWRLPGAILGIISVFLVYKLGRRIFNENTGLIAAFLFSFDGLNFVQSRTGMNDIYLVTFALASVLCLLNRKFFISAIFLGLAFSSKWSSFYLLGLNGLLIGHFFLRGKIKFKEAVRAVSYFAVLAPIIYLISYLPFFFLGHTTDQFVELQKQMWWYHSNLVATHDYSSPAWSWPLNLYPVWYFVEYHKEGGLVSNIFASGNPVLFWMGIGAMLITIYDFLMTYRKSKTTINHDIPHGKKPAIILDDRDRFIVILLGFFVFWLPWIFSPRIMFLYHYSPSIPFLCLSLGYQVELMVRSKKSRLIGFVILGLVLTGFLLVYPMLTGIPLPRDVFSKFFDFNLTKNPFAP